MSNFSSKFYRFSKTKLIVIFLSLYSISAVLAYFYFQNSTINHQDVISPVGGQVLSVAQAVDYTQAPIPEEVIHPTVLLLGYGGAGHQGGFLADVIMVAHFNLDTKRLGLISIPRDLAYQDRKINGLLRLNGGKLDASALTAAVSQVTGLPINNFIGVDFVGFKRLIGESLGSIEVDVPVDFADDWYPITGEEVNPCGKTPEEIAQLTATLSGFNLEKQFPCRYERISYNQGKHTMHGDEALKYVRSRHSTSDFDRSLRQKVVLEGMRQKLFSLEAVKNLDRYFTAISKNTTHNINLEYLREIAPILQDAFGWQTVTVTLSTQNVLTSTTGSSGQFLLVPRSTPADVTAYIKQQLESKLL